MIGMTSLTVPTDVCKIKPSYLFFSGWHGDHSYIRFGRNKITDVIIVIALVLGVLFGLIPGLQATVITWEIVLFSNWANTNFQLKLIDFKCLGPIRYGYHLKSIGLFLLVATSAWRPNVLSSYGGCWLAGISHQSTPWFFNSSLGVGPKNWT